MQQYQDYKDYRAEWSAERDEIVKALAAFHQEVEAIPRTKTATIRTQSGGEYEYKFADLNDVMSTIKPLLQKYELFPSQQSEPNPFMENSVLIVTTVYHLGSMQWFTSYLPLVIDAASQRTGAKITYIKRYALGLALNLITEDPDGDLEAAAVSAIGKLKNEMVPKLQQAIDKTKEDLSDEARAKLEDEMLGLVEKLDKWEYDSVWQDLNNFQKGRAREMLEHARGRKYGERPKLEPREVDENRKRA